MTFRWLTLVTLLVSTGLMLSCRKSGFSGTKSPMDPHFHENGPWFEGWYTRIVDHAGQRDFAVIVGSFVRQGVKFSDSPLEGYVALVIHDHKTGKTETVEGFPERTELQASGEPVTKNPDDKSNANFRWQADSFGSMTQDSIDLKFPSGEVFKAQFSSTRPIFPDQPWVGPEGLAAKLPFIWSHWFIYSLASDTNYQFSKGSTQITGRAVSHMEKNYGSGFPNSWIWLHAISENGANRLSLAGGPAPVSLIQPEVWSAIFKTEKIDWVFLPGIKNLTVTRDIKPCDGEFQITILNPLKKLEIRAKGLRSDFVGIATASPQGWVKAGAHENYNAHIEIDAYELNLLGQQTLVQHVSADNSVLEFGGTHRCPTMKL
jgi:hypothetical protein